MSVIVRMLLSDLYLWMSGDGYCYFAGWTELADSRPSFAELGDEFAKMARDPGRYLLIQVSFREEKMTARLFS